MTIRNVQRVSLGSGVSGFSFDSGVTLPNADMGARSAEGSSVATGTSTFAEWAELEKNTLETLMRRRKIGYVDATKSEI